MLQFNRPATVQELLVILDKLFTFAHTFCGVTDVGRIESATGFYLKALEGLPADIADLAVENVCATYKYGSQLPKPADLIEAIAHEWGERKMVQIHLDRALRFGENPRVTDGVKRRVPLPSAICT